MKANIREPAVSGMFYPANPEALRQMVAGFLAAAESGPPPKAIIAPHAGYIYSGPIAASAYIRISSTVSRVVLIGPSHRVLLRGIAGSSAAFWRTPLGDVPVECPAGVAVNDAAHAQEHSLEVQLPFLQVILGHTIIEVPEKPTPPLRHSSLGGDFKNSPPLEGWPQAGVGYTSVHLSNAVNSNFTLIPLVAGDASAEAVAEVLEKLWGGPETLIVISSDLSHYEPYETARKMDCAAAEAILALDERGLECDNACGLVPICGLLRLAKKKQLHAELIDLRNSGDTVGPHDQVVGYGAFAFYE